MKFHAMSNPSLLGQSGYIRSGDTAVKALLACASVLLFCALATATPACTMKACVDRGLELTRSFSLRVTYQGKPLTGASVQITGNSEGASKALSAVTDPHGIVRFANLPPGNYSINAYLLGIAAGYDCYHINSSASRKAKRSLHYEWGGMPPSFRQAVGRFVDFQSPKNGNPLERLLHTVELPIAQARLELRQPQSETVRATFSDADGRFAFDQVPNGIYVLHIDAGTAQGDHSYDAADLLVEFGDKAARNSIVISHRDAVGGSCGGTGFEL